jgi:DNA-binding transcriptional LysR family regulator
MRFDLTDLRLFVHVAEAGSITRGAALGNMALASASERIRGMEDAAGVALLTRGRRGVEPTPAGRALLHHARIVLGDMEHLRGAIGEYSRGLKGHVRLLANTAAMTEFLPEALAPWLARHGNIDIHLEEKLSYEIAEAIGAGMADIGVLADTADRGALESIPFRLDRLVLICPRSHPLSARRSLAFGEVVDHDFVGLTSGSPLQDYIDQQAARAGHRLTFRARLRGFDGICHMVGHGVGLGVVPETAARRHARSIAIRSVRLTDPWALRQLMLCVRRLDALPSHAQALVRHLAGTEGAGAVSRRTGASGSSPASG